MSTPATSSPSGLKKTLGPVMLWGLGVGYVISGMYFGWNLGLAEGGPIGLLLALLAITVMYLCFTLSYAELACAIPRAGGLFVYANRALGPRLGFMGGMTQIIEYLFAPPAISLAIGSYLGLYFPSVPVTAFAVGAYVLFTLINAWGVKLSAIVELVITAMAVVEILIFAGVVGPHFSIANFSANALPNGAGGIFAAIPFAIWFYLAIEGVANAAEEAKEPQQRNISIGFISAMLTLVVLAMLTFFCAVGVGGWEKVVYKTVDGVQTSSDSPLPMAMAQVVGDSSGMFHLLVGIGLMGLIASFHGIVMCASRATFEFGRSGYLPRFLGRIHAGRGTPIWALVINLAIGITALFSGKTGELITISAFGALGIYIIGMISLLVLRQREPELARPYKTPFYPVLPITALTIASLAMAAMAWYNGKLFGIFLAIIAAAYVYYFIAERLGTIDVAAASGIRSAVAAGEGPVGAVPAAKREA